MISSQRNFDRGILFFLFAFEALLFSTVYHREVASYPPLFYDQAYYLEGAYGLQEDVLAHGLGKLWKAVWSAGHPTGVALPIEGALSGLIIGGARFPQLCVNLMLFFALQVVAFYSARALSGNRFSAYLLVGLILCQATAWLQAGGLFDFRIDFAAYCLYGIWTCSVLRSKLFLERGWAIGCGLIGAYLVLHRFLTIVYLLGVLAGFAIVCFAVGFFARSDMALRNRVQQRLKNLGLSCAALFVLAGPILLLNSGTIWNYYVVGHVLNDEKYIRAIDLGVHDLGGHLLFYPKSIINDHLGQAFLWALAIALAGGVAAHFLRGTTKIHSVAPAGPSARQSGNELESSQKTNGETFLLQITFLLGVIVCPILALTLDILKSSIVGGIVGVPIALLVVILASVLLPKRESASLPKLFAGSAVLIFALGVSNQLNLSSRHWPEFEDRGHLSQMAEFNQWLVNYANEYRWKSPGISLDVISGVLNAATITTLGFEKTGQFIEFRGLLGSSIFGPSREEALKLLAKSDFVILTSTRPPGNFPFTRTIATYWTDLNAWADKHLVVAKTQRFNTSYPYTATVYVRPSAQLRDVSGDWITSQGVLIEVKRSDLERFPLIRLKGAADFSALQKVPSVTASLEPPDESPQIPAIFQRLGNQYQIEINASSVRLPAEQMVHIRVKFDTFFVRKDAALHNDFRELVVRTPEVSLLPVGE
jgi:hypothetical protein